MPTEECVTVMFNGVLYVLVVMDTNAVFVVDLTKLKSPNDITCDNMGT